MTHPAPHTPPRHGWAHWKKVILDVARTFIDRDTSPRCAATAFFGFLSFFPAIATVALVYGLVADQQTLASLLGNLEYVLPPMAIGFVVEQLDALSSQTRFSLGLGLLISVPVALWSASRGVDALLFAMSRVRAAPERRNFFAATTVAVAFSVGGSTFVVAALLTVAGLPALIPFPTGDAILLLVLRWPILMALTIAVMLVLYRWGPDRHPRRWRYIWPGAVVGSLLWILAGAVFSIYVQNWGNFNATFGSVSAAVVLLLWMYNSAQIFVVGAAFNAALEREDLPDHGLMPALDGPPSESAPAGPAPRAAAPPPRGVRSDLGVLLVALAATAVLGRMTSRRD